MFSGLRQEATLTNSVSFSGIGVHSGIGVSMIIEPAYERHGIVFQRTDVGRNSLIKLSPSSVQDPNLCTRVVNKYGISVSVVEHLLAAFRICGVTNALIKISAEEVPIMDGSAIEFVNAFKAAGITYQDAYVPAVVVTSPISISVNNSSIRLTPSYSQEITVKVSYDRINKVVKDKNEISFDLNGDLREISRARTFGWVDDLGKVQAIGLAKGTSLENTVGILCDGSIANKEGFRNPYELVMHKCLDLIGDISVLGYDIIGKIEGINTSHASNNVLMRRLLKELNSHKVITAEATFDEDVNFA